MCHRPNPSGQTMTLGSPQPLTEMSTRDIAWVCKGGLCVGLTILPSSCADCLEIWEPQVHVQASTEIMPHLLYCCFCYRFREIGVQHYFIYLGSHFLFSLQLGAMLSSMDK